MAEIIKKGKKHKVIMCKNCECIFSYKPYEIYKNREHYYINCPDCLHANIVGEVKENIIEEANENG